jgi:hypothetical protein
MNEGNMDINELLSNLNNEALIKGRLHRIIGTY